MIKPALLQKFHPQGTADTNCNRLCCASPVSMASASLVFQCCATLSARGSSGLGALNSAWMLQQQQTHQHNRRNCLQH
jgi:hypothetical protein